MAISRFQSRFKTRTDLMDNITPNNVVQMNASVPHGEWKPANWLPTVWQNEKSKDYFTISSGKIVSLDASGRVVPSGLLRRCLDATDVAVVGEEIVRYDDSDKDARVIDITTGEFVTGPKSVSLQDFIDAVIANGWLPQNTSTVDLAALKLAAEAFISAPVGIAAYDVYVWAGDDPANLHFTNYQKQHLIQFFTDIQMKVAHVCEAAATAVASGGLTLIEGADLALMPRYVGLDMANVVGYDLELGRLATPTSRTPLTFAQGSWRERSDISLLVKAGDFYLDADAGIILFWEDGGNAAPVDSAAAALAGNISVFEYSSAASEQEQMTMMVGDCRPGDFVSFDEMSNFKVAEAADHTSQLVVGRLLALYKEPRGLLERVRTGFAGDDFDATAKMPGSATKGFSDLITLSSHHGESVADEIAVINVKIQ
jgi:putative intracellular protease/amidase